MADFVIRDNFQYQDTSRVPLLDSCCYIFPLRTGVQLIAFSELIVGLALFIFTITIGTYNELSEELYHLFYKETERELLYLHYSSLLDVIFAVYLLIGIFKNRPHYAKVWCVAQAVHLFVSCSVTIYNSLVLTNNMEFDATFVLVNCMFTGLDVYYLLVIYSYYRSTKEYCRNVCPAV